MNVLAQANATKLIDKYCYESPSEINLEALLYAENLKLKEEPLYNCEGKILFDEDTGIITVNSLSKDANQKRFTIAHEMGHFYNEKGKGSYRCGHHELYGTRRNLTREADANDFAAEMLMHEKWFVDFVKGKMLSTKLLINTANHFGVSLSATAIRYAEIGTHPAAVVMSKEGKVKWSFINKGFRIQFIKWGAEVSDLSYTSDFFKGDPIPAEAEDVPARAWFRGSFYIKDGDRVNEFNIPFTSYNSILTVLYFD
jgi:Zn-dependent peptidase ImmA (M78 family)